VIFQHFQTPFTDDGAGISALSVADDFIFEKCLRNAEDGFSDIRLRVRPQGALLNDWTEFGFLSQTASGSRERNPGLIARANPRGTASRLWTLASGVSHRDLV
jgi:hypothetical protein